LEGILANVKFPAWLMGHLTFIEGQE